MIDRESLMSKLRKDINRTKYKIEHRNLFNLRAYAVTALLKSGIALDYALPFIFSSIILFNVCCSNGNIPFVIDEVEEPAKIITMDTSNGIHKEKTSFDYEYDAELMFEHSTAWVLNDSGLFERTVTSYKIDDPFILNNIYGLLFSSKEEIDKLVDVVDIQTIEKSTLDSEDEMYDEDMLIIMNIREDESNVKKSSESVWENCVDTLIYLIAATYIGTVFWGIKKVVIGNKVKESLKHKEIEYIPVEASDLLELRKRLELKQANLSMLESIGDDTNKPFQKVKK